MSKFAKAELEEIRIFFEKLFVDSGIQEFSYEDFKDDDVNYLLTPSLRNSKKTHPSNFNFLLYYSHDKTLTFFSPLLYNIKDDDSLIYTLNVINSINSKIAIGKLYMSDNNTISYINRIIVNNLFSDLTSKSFKEYIDAYIMTSLELLKAMEIGKSNG